MERPEGHRGLLVVESGYADSHVRAAYVEPLERELIDAFYRDAIDAAPVRIASAGTHAHAGAGPAGLDVAAALEELWAAGARDVTVASTHLIDGASYEGVRRAVRTKARLFDAVRLMPPLLSSASDAAALARAIDSRYPRREREAVVLVGHGSDGAGQLAYLALGYELHARGRSDASIGVLRGDPSCSAVAAELADAGVEAVTLVPLMVAAGRHARRDVLGADCGSWASRLKAAGFTVRAAADGLGAWPEVRALVCERLRRSVQVAAGEGEPVPSRCTSRFPLFIDLSGKRCLVVGGGEVGCRRAAALARFGARVTLVDPAFRDEGRRVAAELLARPYRAGDEDGCTLAVAATDDRAVNRMLGERCRRLGIPVSVADAPDECTFFFPALCEGAHAVAGVVSRDATPDGHALTARVAAQIRDILP